MQTELLAPDSPRWADLLSGIRHDVYHLPAYAVFAARHHDEGMPLAFVAEEDGNHLFVPIIVRQMPADIAIDGTQLRDATSPRGYPGPLLSTTSRNSTGDFPDRAITAFRGTLNDLGIVSAFIRTHPLLPPPLDALRRAGALIEHGDSVSIDLELSADELWRQTRENHRRDINRIRRAGYVARIDDTWASFDEFVTVYQESMDRLAAAPFWRLSREYFIDLRASLGVRLNLCVVETAGQVAAAGLLTEEDGIVEYHLAGTGDDYVAASPSKLIVDFARTWAKSRGARRLHLGGSLRRNDALYHFKAGFSPIKHAVRSWRVIADAAAYRALVDRWEGIHGVAGDPIDEFFPAYRKRLPSP
jgi:hypothetical protein